MTSQQNRFLFGLFTTVTACNSDLDCELNGKCISGKCKCYPGWQGPTCGSLKLKPAPIGVHGASYALYPTKRPIPPHHEGGHHRQISGILADTSDLPPEPGVPITWGGTVIEDSKGKHHLFVDVCCYTPTTIMVRGKFLHVYLNA